MDRDQVPDWSQQRYLLIDDFAGIRQMLQDILRNVGAEKIDHAATGEEAVALLKANYYDVVLCDYKLGTGKTGLQVLEEAKLGELIWPACIWLMVSGVKTTESVMGTAEFQPDGYLLKPVTETVLMARLNRAWEKKQVFADIDKAHAAKDYLRAVKCCDDRLATDRLHADELLRMKANLLLKSSELEQAAAVFKQALAERDHAWAKTGLAKIHIQNGEYGLAKRLLTEVLLEHPSHLEAYDQLALALQQLGELGGAERVLESAANLSPNSVIRQKNLGEIALKLGNFGVAEKAFRKSVAVGEHSVVNTPDAYLGLASVCTTKKRPREALGLLTAVQKTFDSQETQLRAKVAEGLIHHGIGDEAKAQKAAAALRQLVAGAQEQPDASTCMDMAKLLFATGDKETPATLLREVVKNNHENQQLLAQVQHIFDAADMGEEGAALVETSRKEAVAMMDKGMLLWQEGQRAEAVEWMRNARKALPSNVRILLNCAHIFIQYMHHNGVDHALAEEARTALLQTERLAPGQKRFAQLMELLEQVM